MGGGNFLLARFPLGEAATRRKFPRLEFLPLWMPDIQQRIIAEAIESLFAAAEHAPADAVLLDELAHLLNLVHRPLDAVPVLKRGLQVAPDNFRIWEGLANSYCWARQVALAESALEQAAAAARRSEDQVNAGRISNLHCGKLMQQ
jgi:predicted Zn-dependent protease